MPSNGDSFGGSQSLGEDNFYALYQQEGDSDGVWFPTAGILTASLQIKDLENGGVLTVHCSNDPDQPDNNDDGILGQTINGDGNDKLLAVSAPYSLWKKVKKDAGTPAEETTAHYAGVRRG